eukprot:4022766-Prymnesium_polylepis.1
MAAYNPMFDPEKPYDEMIIWFPEGLKRLISMDETDVRTDQAKRGKSVATRSVIVNAPGSRRGHSKGKSGKKAAATSHRGGYAAGSKQVGGKQGLPAGKLDTASAIATKSAGKISFAGATRGDGKALSPHIMSDHPLSTEELGSAPCGTALDSSGKLVPATFNVNTSGGMLEDDMVMWMTDTAIPSTTVTPEQRGMACFDGLGQHHAFKVVQVADKGGFDIALRFPHGSSRGQHEDFEHFQTFRKKHEDAKIRQQVVQFQEARAAAAAACREPTRAELLKAAVLTNAASLRCAKQAWEESFAEEKVQRGWREEGVVPFTRKLMWDLRAEEKALGIKVSAVPPVDVSAFNLPPAPATATATVTALALAPRAGTALTAAQPAQPAWDEGIDEEVGQLLRAEVGDAALNVAPVPAPKNLPKLGSALLFKLAG